MNQHELSDSDSSDEESAADLEVNAHDLKKRNDKPKIKGLLHFSDSGSEDECALKCPSTMEETLVFDARGEIDDPGEEAEESIEQKVATRIPEAKQPKGLLHFDDSEEAKPILHAFAQTKEDPGEPEESQEGIGGEGSDGVTSVQAVDTSGVVGEPEADTSGLAESETGRLRQVEEFHAKEGVRKFSDNKDEAEDKQQVRTRTEETKVWTGSECKKAGIEPPPVEQAEHPQSRKPGLASPKPSSPKAPKISSPKQSPKTASPGQSAKTTSPKQSTPKAIKVANPKTVGGVL